MQPDILHILMTVKPARLAKRHKRIVHIYYGAGPSVKRSLVSLPRYEVLTSCCPICGSDFTYLGGTQVSYDCGFKISYSGGLYDDSETITIASASDIHKCRNYVVGMLEYEEWLSTNEDII